MNCISNTGTCPCKDCGNSCYLRECESPQQRSPNGEGVPLAVRPAFAGVLALAVFLCAGTFGYADALSDEAEEKEDRVQRILQPPIDVLARKYTAIIVACANGGAFSVGDLLVFCDPHRIPIAK